MYCEVDVIRRYFMVENLMVYYEIDLIILFYVKKLKKLKCLINYIMIVLNMDLSFFWNIVGVFIIGIFSGSILNVLNVIGIYLWEGNVLICWEFYKIFCYVIVFFIELFVIFGFVSFYCIFWL